MLTCYYAHFMGTYDTPVEARDVKALEALGFGVTNPNSIKTQAAFLAYQKTHLDSYMRFFEMEAAQHDVVAFRSLPDGSIPGGVSKEINAARREGKIIIELPCGLLKRGMGHEETVEYLENSGQR